MWAAQGADIILCIGLNIYWPELGAEAEAEECEYEAETNPQGRDQHSQAQPAAH